MKKEILPDYFLVNRRLLDSNRWLAEKFTRAQAWIDLIGLAQHTSNFFLVRGIKVSVNRGQLAYSQITLAKRWRWSRDKVRRYLKCLENEDDIIQQNNEVTTIITIVKYDLWQGKTIEDNTTDNTTEKQQKNNKQDTYKKDNKEKKEKNIPSEPSSHEDIVQIIKLFEVVNPLIGKLYGSPPQRAAVQRMLKVFGREKLESMIGALPEVHKRKYWAKSTTPVQLENNIPIYKAKNEEEKTKVVGSKAAIIL